MARAQRTAVSHGCTSWGGSGSLVCWPRPSTTSTVALLRACWPVSSLWQLSRCTPAQSGDCWENHQVCPLCRVSTTGPVCRTDAIIFHPPPAWMVTLHAGDRKDVKAANSNLRALSFPTAIRPRTNSKTTLSVLNFKFAHADVALLPVCPVVFFSNFCLYFHFYMLLLNT